MVRASPVVIGAVSAKFAVTLTLAFGVMVAGLLELMRLPLQFVK
jgi:hypothetical protein